MILRTIDFTKCDTDYNTNDKTIAVVDNVKNGTFTLHGGAPMTRSTYVPNPNFVGKDRLVFTVATTDSDVASEEKTIFITVK